MNFNHSEDRRMLSDTLRRYFTDQYPVETRIESAYTAPYHLPEKWQEIAELGVLAALAPESHGGFGGTGFDISVVFEELGRSLCNEPLLPALLATRLLAHAETSPLLAEVLSGETIAAVAVYEPGNFDDLSALTTTATQTDSGWQVSGEKSVVYGAPQATKVLVLAQHAGGLGLFVTDTAERAGYAMIDGGGAADLRFENANAECILEDARAAIEDALEWGRVALCAEAVGAMEVLIEMTVDYLKQRQQFGQPIALFQALQHRIVDMAIELEQARSITILAASKLGTAEQKQFAAMAKNLIGRAALLVGEEATQLHGGIGMTWEYAGSHYAKRLVMIDHQLGDRFYQLGRMLDAA